MSFIDVFNGDADGICALHQLRLTTPRPEALLVTGVKRDIGLLSRLQHVQDCDITVLDISLDHNRNSLQELLAQNTLMVMGGLRNSRDGHDGFLPHQRPVL